MFTPTKAHITLKSKTRLNGADPYQLVCAGAVYLTILCLRFSTYKMRVIETPGYEDDILHVSQLVQYVVHSRFYIFPGFFLLHLFLSLISLILPSPDLTTVRVIFEIMLEILFCFFVPTLDSEEHFRSQIIYGRNSYLL